MRQTDDDVATVVVDWVQRMFECEVEIWQAQAAVKTIGTETAFVQAVKRVEDYLIRSGGDLDGALAAAIAARDWQAAELLDIPIQAEASQRKPQ